MPTYRLLLEYDGTDYVGWQRQATGTSIQEVLEQALQHVLGGEVVRLVGSGRTDSGVHALGQVATFRTEIERSDRSLRLGLNSMLPPDIACRDARRVPDGFHALRSARRKHYRYRILDQGERSPLRARQVWFVRGPLDLDAMSSAAGHVLGTHDFTSFRGGGSAARTSVRTIHSLDIRRDGDEVVIDVTGGGFLRHMVRILVGNLVEVGLRRKPPGAMRDLLDLRDRTKAGKAAPAQGLCMVSVTYDVVDVALPEEDDE